MSQTIVTPPLSLTLRRSIARMWDDPESRSVVVGLLGMLLVHLLLFLAGPYLLRSDPTSSVLRPHSSQRQFSIQIAPDTFPAASRVNVTCASTILRKNFVSVSGKIATFI